MEAAELRGRELLRAVAGAEQLACYEQLGLLGLPGGGPGSGYAYLVYPHRPLVSYETRGGRLLAEHCVRFLDAGERLPAADDVLARWISLRAGERELIATASLDRPGRQVDPVQARRDIARLAEWRAARAPAAA